MKRKRASRLFVGAASALLVLVFSACGGNTSSDEHKPDASAGMPNDAGGTGGSGAFRACSAPAGQAGTEVCASGEYCDFDADDCGRSGALGRCTPMPPGCSPPFRPTCGCDGMVHENACATAQRGTDQAVEGCRTPSGYFQCGSVFCSFDTFCRRVASNVEGFADSFQCELMPDACSTERSCECLRADDCGATCTIGVHGGLSVTCGAALQSIP